MEKGYFQIYTGNGKGKTTAALGIALRAMGHDFRTYIGQFMKGQIYGEITACRAIIPGHVTIEQYGKDTFMHVGNEPGDDDIRMAREGLGKAEKAMISGSYDIVVFDEILTAHHFHLLTLEEMTEAIGLRPEGVEVIFTGRYAPRALIEIADLVTEMKEVKHYYQKGIEARKGIER